MFFFLKMLAFMCLILVVIVGKSILFYTLCQFVCVFLFVFLNAKKVTFIHKFKSNSKRDLIKGTLWIKWINWCLMVLDDHGNRVHWYRVNFHHQDSSFDSSSFSRRDRNSVHTHHRLPQMNSLQMPVVFGRYNSLEMIKKTKFKLCYLKIFCFPIKIENNL